MRETDFDSKISLIGLGILRQGEGTSIPDNLIAIDSASFWVGGRHEINHQPYSFLFGHILYQCENSNACNLDVFNLPSSQQSNQYDYAELEIPSGESFRIFCIANSEEDTKECEVYIDYGSIISIVKLHSRADDKPVLDTMQTLLNEIDNRIERKIINTK